MSRQRESEFDEAINYAPAALYRMSIDSAGEALVTWLNDGAQSLLGLPAATASIGLEALLEYVQPLDPDECRRQLAASRENRTRWSWTGRVTQPGTAATYLHNAAAPRQTSDGALVWDGVMVTTDGHSPAAAASFDPSTLPGGFNSRLQQAAGDAIWEWHIGDGETYYSPGWEALLGHPSATMTPHIDTLVDLVHPDDRGEVQSAVSHHLQHGEPFDLDVRMRHADGTYVAVNCRGQAEWDEHGEPTALTGVLRDITRRKYAEERLRESETRFRDLVVRLDAGLVVQGPQAEIVFANPAAGKILGLSQVRLMGSATNAPEWNLVYENGEPLPPSEYPVMRVLATGHEIHGLTVGVLRPDDRDPTWVIMNAYPQRDESASIQTVATTFIDITERKRAETQLDAYRDRLEDLVAERTKALRRARDEAERATAAKSQFLSRMRHELRTPLNSILGFSQLLETDPQHPLQPYQQEQVREIIHAGTHLLAMIDQLVAMSRSEKGQLELRIEPVALEPVLSQCIDRLRPLAEPRRVAVESEVDEGMHALADAERLDQVLGNLLSSAVKRSREGGTVSVHCTSIDEQRVDLSIHSTGGSIADEALAMLTTPFDRSEPNDKELDGDAIGLAFSKRIVEAMNGTIEVSTPHEGTSTFSLRLPASVPPEDGTTPTTGIA